jgi:hypothetical protein
MPLPMATGGKAELSHFCSVLNQLNKNGWGKYRGKQKEEDEKEVKLIWLP